MDSMGLQVPHVELAPESNAVTEGFKQECDTVRFTF